MGKASRDSGRATPTLTPTWPPFTLHTSAPSFISKLFLKIVSDIVGGLSQTDCRVPLDGDYLKASLASLLEYEQPSCK